MTKKATNTEIIESLEALQVVVTGLVAKAKGEEELEFFQPEEPPTPREISINLRGDPDFHIDNPKEFLKLKKFYDPERVPFTNYTAFISKYLQKDTRAYKPVKLNGVVYKRTTPNAGPDAYWIERGVRDVMERPLWHYKPFEGRLTKEQKAKFVKEYEGGYSHQRTPGQY